MFQQWIIQAAIVFIVRQIAKFGSSLNWDMVKSDVDYRIRQLLPGTFLDNLGATLGLKVVVIAQGVLSSAEELQALADYAAAGKFEEALKYLKDIIVSDWAPSEHPHDQLIFAALGGSSSADVPTAA